MWLDLFLGTEVAGAQIPKIRDLKALPILKFLRILRSSFTVMATMKFMIKRRLKAIRE